MDLADHGPVTEEAAILYQVVRYLSMMIRELLQLQRVGLSST